MSITWLHATCVLVGEAGVLIRGASGAGKSELARRLLAEARARRMVGRLIGDDRIAVEARGGRLIARGHPAVAGLIEARGVGPIEAAPEPACVVRLAVDLGDRPTPRLPDPRESIAEIAGVTLPALAIGRDARRVDLVFATLGRMREKIRRVTPPASQARPEERN